MNNEIMKTDNLSRAGVKSMNYYRITYDAQGCACTYRAVWGAFKTVGKAEAAMKNVPRPNAKIEQFSKMIKVA